MNVLRWLVDRWYIPLIAVAAVLTWVFLRSKPPKAILSTELEAIKAGAQARVVVAEDGAERARAEVLRVHATEVAALDEAQAERAVELAEDPQALAKFLVRAASQ